MRRIAISVMLVATLLPALRAQQSKTAPCPSTATLDDLTKALDDAVSGPGNKDRTCLRAILLPETRLSPIRKAQDGSFSPRILTVDDWIAAVAKRGSEAFYERQIKVKTPDRSRAGGPA